MSNDLEPNITESKLPVSSAANDEAHQKFPEGGRQKQQLAEEGGGGGAAAVALMDFNLTREIVVATDHHHNPAAGGLELTSSSISITSARYIQCPSNS